MKKLILFFFILLPYSLFSQSWEFIPQDSILQFNEIYQNYGKLNISTIITKGDSTIFVRYDRDTILMIYDYNKKEIFHILKEDFWKCLKNDSLYNIYKKTNIWDLFIDSKGYYWFTIPDTLYKNTPVFKVTPDTTYLINQIYVRELDSSIYITPFPNKTIRRLKEDKNGDIWLFLLSYIRFNDSLHNEFEILCKYVNNRFETIFMKQIFWQYVSKCNFVFDNQNRVWYVVGDTCYIIKDEVVEKKISTWDAKDGYGYFSELAIDTKGNFFATNKSMLLFKFDGDSLTTDRRILDIERYLTHVGSYPYRMRIDSLDNLWLFGYETCNLYKIDKEGNLTTYDVPKVDTSAEVEWCYKMYMEVDRHGRLWIPAQSMGGKSYGIFIFNPDTTTSVEEQINSNTPGMPDVKVYTIYPNPADNIVTLEFFIYYDVVDQLEVGIYNIMGMKIKDVTGQIDYDRSRMRANLKFSVADLPRGSYIVSVKAGKTSTYKLLLVGY